jgi:hypothetical protein
MKMLFVEKERKRKYGKHLYKFSFIQPLMLWWEEREREILFTFIYIALL